MNSSTSSFKIFFLIFSLIFFIGSAFFVIGSEFIVRTMVIPSSDYEEMQKDFFLNTSDYVVFSDSHGANGILESSKLSNFSRAGDNLMSISIKAKFYANLNQPKGIILPAAYQFFAPYRLSSDQSSEIDDFLKVTSTSFEFMRPVYRKYLLSYWVESIKRIIKENKSSITNQNSKLNKTTISDSSFPEANIRVQLHKPIINPGNSSHAKLFENAIKEIKLNGIKICMVQFPLSSSYRNKMKEFNNFDETKKYLKNVSLLNNIIFVDYSSKFEDHLFSDSDHLNQEGAKELTSQILNDCFGENE